MFTRDGLWAYAVAQNTAPNSAVIVFRRDPNTGALTQVSGTHGCVTSNGSSQAGANTCDKDPTLNEASGIAISSDDRFLYVSDYGSHHRVHVFSRDSNTGALAEVQCISDQPAPTGCDAGRVIGDLEYLAITPDGKHAYGADFRDGMSVFDRNRTTGRLTQKTGKAGCISDDGHDDTGASTCTVARVVAGSYVMLISPSGSTLYDVANDADGGFSTFHINADGTLTQLSGAAGCATDDGKDQNAGHTCSTVRLVRDPYGGAISPDGRTLYVSSFGNPVGGIAAFSLNATSGAATQLAALAGCISTDGSSDGTASQCVVGRAVTEGYGLSVSPDGLSVYQATDLEDTTGLAVYAREAGPSCAAVSGTTAFGRPITVRLSCLDRDGDPVTIAIIHKPVHGSLSAIHPVTRAVTYTPANGFSGIDTFTFAGSDGVNSSAPVSATITVSRFTGVTLASQTLSADSRGHVTLTLGCPAMAPGRSCAVAADLFATKGTLLSVASPATAAKLLGRGTFTLPAGKTVKRRLALNPSGRALASGGKFKARLLLTSHVGPSQRQTRTYAVTVKP